MPLRGTKVGLLTNTHTHTKSCMQTSSPRAKRESGGMVGLWEEVNSTPPSSGRKCFATSPSRMNFYGPCYVLSFFSSTFFWLVEFCLLRWSLTQQCVAAELLLRSFELRILPQLTHFKAKWLITLHLKKFIIKFLNRRQSVSYFFNFVLKQYLI